MCRMKTSDFDYELPNELIAQEPMVPRYACRLLVMDKDTGEVADRIFSDIIDELLGAFDGKSTSDLEAKRNVFVEVLVANVLNWDWRILVILWIEGVIELKSFSDHVDTEVGLGVETECVTTIGNTALKAIAEGIGFEVVIVVFDFFCGTSHLLSE